MLYMTTLKGKWGKNKDRKGTADHKSCNHMACVAPGECFSVHRTSLLFDEAQQKMCQCAHFLQI